MINKNMLIHFYYKSALMRVIDDDITPYKSSCECGINKRVKETHTEREREIEHGRNVDEHEKEINPTTTEGERERES